MKFRLASVVLGVTIGAACSPANGPQSGSQHGAATPAGQPRVDVKYGSSAVAEGLSSASGGARGQRFREVVIPAGTALPLELQTAVASDKSRAEDPVRAKLLQPIVVDGTTVVPAGAIVNGSVLEASESGRVSGRASVAIRFDRLRSGDDTYDIHTARIGREAAATKGKDAEKIGIGAGAGAVVGAIAGGKKGAAIGSIVGAGAGTGVVLATRGEEVRMGPGAKVKTTFVEPLTIAVPID
jgi:hypothetical protein